MTGFAPDPKFDANEFRNNEEVIVTVDDVTLVKVTFRNDARVLWLGNKLLEEVIRDIGPISEWQGTTWCIGTKPGSGKGAGRRYFTISEAVSDDGTPF